MSTAMLLFIAAIAAGTMGGAWYCAAHGFLNRRRLRVILASVPPLACALLALLSGSLAALVPPVLFGGLIGFCAATGDHRLWLKP